MSTKIDVHVWSDFVCPWCFLASTSLEKLKQSQNIELHWRSFELRPAGSPPMPDEYRQRIMDSRPQFNGMALERYGIEINAGPFGIDSRKALIGSKYAEEMGKGDAYHDKTFRAYWQEAQDISQDDVLEAIAIEVGLDGTEFLEALNNPGYDQLVEADVQQAHAYQITGVPGMIFHDKYFVSGAQPYETLVNVVEQVREREGLD